MGLTSHAFTMRPSPGLLTKAPHGRPTGLGGEAQGRSEQGQRGRVQIEIRPSETGEDLLRHVPREGSGNSQGWAF